MSTVNLQEPSAAEPMTDARKKVLVYSVYADYKKDFPAVEDMLPVEAMSLMNRNRLIFVDTRKPEEMAVSMLPGAITKEQFLQNPGLYRDKTVVTYCTISYRSGVFARDIKRKNIHMVNLTGGILAWIHEGGEIYNSRGQITNRVHVFGKRWNYAPDHYETDSDRCCRPAAAPGSHRCRTHITGRIGHISDFPRRDVSETTYCFY